MEEAKNIQESLQHKVSDTNIVTQVIDLLARMNERSKPERAKVSLAKLLDMRRETTVDVTTTILKFRNAVSEWEAVSKVPIDGLMKTNLLFRTLMITEQIEGNIRTKVDLNSEKHEDMYEQVELAIKDLAASFNTSDTYAFENAPKPEHNSQQRFASRDRFSSRSKERSFSRGDERNMRGFNRNRDNGFQRKSSDGRNRLQQRNRSGSGNGPNRNYHRQRSGDHYENRGDYHSRRAGGRREYTGKNDNDVNA